MFPRGRGVYSRCYDQIEIKHSEPFSRWKMGNGRSIKIVNMTKEHLKNCINKIQREKWRMQWLVPLQNELSNR